MTPKDIEDATTLLTHLRMRKDELAKLEQIGTALTSVTLHFGSKEAIGIRLVNSDVGDTETLRGDIIESMTEHVRMSIRATEDLLDHLGVKLEGTAS